jgi:hypothetical protein
LRFEVQNSNKGQPLFNHLFAHDMKRVLLIFIGVTTLMIFSPSGVFGFDFENLMKDLGVLHRTDKEHFERGIKFGKKLIIKTPLNIFILF